MARLTCAGDDADGAITVDAAAARIAARWPVVAGVETVPLARADGRIAAADVRAPLDLPPFDNSAVDGYALRHADLASGRPLPLAGRVPAGVDPGPLAPGSAARIFTGAPLPPGADTVVMQEDARVSAEGVLAPASLAAGANRRARGEDIRAGTVAILAGRRLGPPEIALAAGLGLAEIAVRTRLRVAVFSTGDEVSEPGTPRGAGGIHDANRPMLLALLARLGAEPHDLGILRDEARPLRTRLREAAAGHDLVLTSGGVSVGEEDHVRAAVAAEGGIDLWRVAIKPGRPVALGQVAGTPFVGLPGNPVAAYVTLLFVVRPLLARLAGRADEPPRAFAVRAAFAHRRRPGRREFLRTVLQPGADGVLEAVRAPGGALTGLAGSDGLVDLPEDSAGMAVGDTVAFHPHAGLW